MRQCVGVSWRALELQVEDGPQFLEKDKQEERKVGREGAALICRGFKVISDLYLLTIFQMVPLKLFLAVAKDPRPGEGWGGVIRTDRDAWLSSWP